MFTLAPVYLYLQLYTYIKIRTSTCFLNTLARFVFYISSFNNYYVVIGIASPFVLSVGIRKGSVYIVQYPGLFKALYISNNQICSVEYHINVSLQNVLNHV